MARLASPWLIPLTAATLAAAACSSTGTEPSQNAAEAYLGKWNYDQPDAASMTNMAVLQLPSGPVQAPQIGDITYTLDASDASRTHLIGRTDVGCTWRFRVDPDALRLDPATQLCNNPTSHVSYTITAWTTTVSGNHMTEVFTAKSHRADRDLDFALETGARTRTSENDTDGAAAFVGTWHYEPPGQGELTITADYGNRLTARTGNGCSWTLLVRGNTAKLDPPVQTCPRPGDTTETRTAWTIAATGTRGSTIVVGVDEAGGALTPGAGSLAKG
ncbi:hypothetical protein [Nocardia huaxiensis]|uniref:hypothetical protein n=1 Tax=Nocardia huaxiensis TaxID=2755382 RepID=UPI001E577360|nr:hypothetical protein [Nocardia huaxiensis]UFS96586.1 hypothetical protein LPY97_01185 [Nocardia huaxiensis]